MTVYSRHDATRRLERTRRENEQTQPTKKVEQHQLQQHLFRLCVMCDVCVPPTSQVSKSPDTGAVGQW